MTLCARTRNYAIIANQIDMFPQVELSTYRFDQLPVLRMSNMKDSTQKFIDMMRKMYGADEIVGRGNILNFGGKVTFAIRNSKLYPKGSFWYAIQSDFLEAKFLKHPAPALGSFTALICGDEHSVAIIPQGLLANWMTASPSDRVHIDKKQSQYYLRISGSELINITEYINKYPGKEPQASPVDEPAAESVTTTEQPRLLQSRYRRLKTNGVPACGCAA